MTLGETARSWLLGETLEDKLTPWTGGDDRPGPLEAIPDAPGRPPGLRFGAGRVAFPPDERLGDPEARGVALHFFANHELLAIELMALAILRFPAAPPALRRGLARIVAEEQAHLRGYLARLDGTGVAFGDVPVNAFFWRTLAPVDDPARFLAGLALTFEQANLDYAAWYAEAFRAVGDADTAAALDRVLDDEVGHVRHGRVWFERLRDRRRPYWEAWAEALPAPLTPARARGRGFVAGPRRRAGFADADIARLAVQAHSKGRPPRVWSFVPDLEAEMVPPGPSPLREQVAADLGVLPLFLARRDDVVLVPRAPGAAWLATVQAAGFDLPEVVEGGDAGALAGRKVGGWEPWGPGPSVAARFPVPWDPRWRALYDKAWAAERLRERLAAPEEDMDPADAPMVCATREAVDVAVAALRARGRTPKVKLRFATAGRGMMDPEGPVDEALAAQGGVLVEPWLDRVLDLSVQLDVGADGETRVDAPGRFLADGRGRYAGAVVGRWTDGLPVDLARWLHGEGARPDHVARRLVDTARGLVPAMRALGWVGPAGLDAFVYRDRGAYRLRPVVELNPRRTLGRVARALGRRVARGQVGVWRVLGRHELRRAGHRDFAALAAALGARAPLVLRGRPAVVAEGALWTTDPERARRFAAVLVVGETFDAVVERYAAVGLHVPGRFP